MSRKGNKMKSKLHSLLIAGSITLLAAAGYSVWHFLAKPTRIAFVNYPEYILAPLLDQEINPAIEVKSLPWKEKSGPELGKYDFVIFFGMGLNFTEAQQKILKKLKTPVYTTASTRSETALATLSEKQQKEIQNYLRYGGK